MKSLLLIAGVAPVAALAVVLQDGAFERTAVGEKTGWRTTSVAGRLLAPGKGLEGSGAIGVEGVGTNNCKWLSPPVTVKSGSVYGFSAMVKADARGGSVTLGTPTMNLTKHLPKTHGKWVEEKTVVFTSDRGKTYPETFRLGEYRLNGTFLFDNACVHELKPVYAEKDGVSLGHGERIAGARYTFNTQWARPSRAHARPLSAVSGMAFNSDHFDAGSGSSFMYRHEVNGRKWRSASVTVSASGKKDARATVEVSADGRTWRKAAELENLSVAGARVEIPADALTGTQVFVRFTVAVKSWFRIHGYTFEGEIEGPEMHFAGSTRYLDEATGKEFARVDAPSFYTDGYGGVIDVRDAPFAAWTALSGWKVPKSHPLPKAKAAAVRIAAAANEAEAGQLILQPKTDLASARVSCGELRKTKWFGLRTAAVIPSSSVEVFRVGYVPVVRVKDVVGCADDWPDTLLPQDAKPTRFTPAGLKANEHAPYWIRVKVPKGTPPGVYKGSLTVSAERENGAATVTQVPIEVEVYGFSMPDKMTMRTAFGMGTHYIDKYHRLKTREDKKKVYGYYFESLAAHHVSPYNHTPGVTWKTSWTNGEPVIDWTEWDAAMEDARRRYGFSDFRISSLGLGYGDEAKSHPGVIPGLGMKSTHPEYEKHIAKYLKAVESHLRETGRLKDALLYCYDEPRLEADKIVREGLALVAKYAPGLDRLLTAPVRKTLVGGPNIWCPIARDLHLPGSAERRAAGDRFWWYVCMSPKPPYPSLFIDHPGVDLRVWLWQSWREEIEGILIWNTTWWTSPLAYPDTDRPQNPYLDATAWSPRYPGVGNSNGDGRFFYPPVRACAAFDDGEKIGPVLERPVETIRLEYVRDGIEDFEYFVMLKKLDPANPLLKVPPEVSASPTEFSIDPIHMERHREKIAREIERLSGRR
jgi:hypothetical protein